MKEKKNKRNHLSVHPFFAYLALSCLWRSIGKKTATGTQNGIGGVGKPSLAAFFAGESNAGVSPFTLHDCHVTEGLLSGLFPGAPGNALLFLLGVLQGQPSSSSGLAWSFHRPSPYLWQCAICGYSLQVPRVKGTDLYKPSSYQGVHLNVRTE